MELVVAIAMIVLGLFVFVGSFSIDLGAGYDRIGPRFFPYLVAMGLLVSGGFLARKALQSNSSISQENLHKTRGSHFGLLSVALVSSVVLLERAGFVVTSVLLFWLVARAFESRRPWRDVIVALAFSVTVYLAFTEGLGLALPQGVLNGIF